MSQRIAHDCAFAAASGITNAFRPLLYEHEVRDAHEEVYRLVRLALDKFVLLQEAEQRRLKARKGGVKEC